MKNRKTKVFALWSKWRLSVYLSIAVLSFSSIEVLANPIRHRIDPLALTFWRFFIATVCLLPITVLRKKFHFSTIRPNDWLGLFFLGCLNVILCMGAHALSIKYASASTAALLIASNPIATSLFAWLILKERYDLRRGLLMGVGFLGVALVALRPSAGVDTPFGIAAGVVGMVGFALYTVLSKGVVQRLGSLTATTLSFLLALIVYFPLLLFLKIPIWPAPDVWPRLLALGVVVSSLGYIAFFKALKDLPAGKASLLFFFKPPVSLFLAWLFLGESISLFAGIGSVLIMAGILFDRKVPAPVGQSAPQTG
jgi:drug/metabolite transporter (DMT)-like permease